MSYENQTTVYEAKEAELKNFFYKGLLTKEGNLDKSTIINFGTCGACSACNKCSCKCSCKCNCFMCSLVERSEEGKSLKLEPSTQELVSNLKASLD